MSIWPPCRGVVHCYTPPDEQQIEWRVPGGDGVRHGVAHDRDGRRERYRLFGSRYRIVDTIGHLSRPLRDSKGTDGDQSEPLNGMRSSAIRPYGHNTVKYGPRPLGQPETVQNAPSPAQLAFSLPLAASRWSPSQPSHRVDLF